MAYIILDRTSWQIGVSHFVSSEHMGVAMPEAGGNMSFMLGCTCVSKHVGEGITRGTAWEESKVSIFMSLREVSSGLEGLQLPIAGCGTG